MNTSSWVIIKKETGEVLLETFSAELVSKLNPEHWEAVPIMEYLGNLNKKIKSSKS